MTEPKFQVGQVVGVCCVIPVVLIPKTIVTQSVVRPAGYPLVIEATGAHVRLQAPKRLYEVSDDRGSWYEECDLFPINPTSEYLESPSHLEVPA